MTADQALDLIRSKVAAGLTPVMKGTHFARYGFRPSQFGSYVYYEDARGTSGCFMPRNVERVLDFVPILGPKPAFFSGEFADVEQEISEAVGRIAAMHGCAVADLRISAAGTRVSLSARIERGEGSRR